MSCSENSQHESSRIRTLKFFKKGLQLGYSEIDLLVLKSVGNVKANGEYVKSKGNV